MKSALFFKRKICIRPKHPIISGFSVLLNKKTKENANCCGNHGGVERNYPEIAKKIKETEEKIKETADKKAREILVEAMYRGATDYVSEYTVSTVKLDDDDMKGRVIGREGRNIRTFEKTTGVDVDLDEEGVIRLSCFDSVRREIARVALERLIADGRIQPSRIEEIVLKTRKETEKLMYQAGEDLCHRVKVYNLPSDVVAMLGRFKYRFSYGQNMITHTLEETKMGIVTDIKQELRKANALKINYSARKKAE